MLYAAQSIPPIDAENAENGHFRTKTNYARGVLNTMAIERAGVNIAETIADHYAKSIHQNQTRRLPLTGIASNESGGADGT